MDCIGAEPENTFASDPAAMEVKQKKTTARKSSLLTSRSDWLREIAPRVKARWQISLHIVKFSAKNVVKFWWRYVKTNFLAKI